MVWEKNEPQDTTKIRNLGTVIRPNWDAIEGGSTSFQPDAFILTDRNALGVGNDPAAAVSGGTSRGNGYTLFCKQDGSGDQQLYGIDPAGTILQFTGSIPALTTSGSLFLPGGLLMQWNRQTVATGGTVTFPTAFAAQALFVSFIPTGTSGTNRIVYRLNGNPTATSFSPIMTKVDNTGITETIYWLAIGQA